MSEELDKFKKDYFSNRILEIYLFFTKEQLEILNKLGIKVENKKYSTFEFDEIQSKIVLIKTKLKEKGISDIEYEQLLNVLDKISEKYNI